MTNRNQRTLPNGLIELLWRLGQLWSRDIDRGCSVGR